MENQIKEIAILDDYRKKGNITEEEYQLKRKQIWETPPGKDEKGNLSLAGHLMDESKRRDLPFWARYERFVRHHDAWMKESVEHKQKAFAELAKDGFTSNMENLIAAYVIYGDANDIRFLQSLLVNCPDDLRMEYHNWYMAKLHGQAFLDQHGAAIQELAAPLFPYNNLVTIFNTRIIRTSAGGKTIQGAGAPKACFNMQTPEVLGDRVIYASGYPVPVENGFVDLGIVEQAVDWLDRRVKELENFAKEAKLEVPAAKHGPPPRRDYQNYRQPSYQQRGRGGNSNGRGAYNRGGYGGSYAGQPRGGYGRGYQNQGGYPGNY